VYGRALLELSETFYPIRKVSKSHYKIRGMLPEE